MKISFVVYGEPKPQGSKIAQPIYRNGKPLMKGNRVVCVARNDNPHLKCWRQEVSWAAKQAHDGPLLDGPIKLTVRFYRPRPKGHFGSGKNANILKASAPKFPTSKPDLTKVLRGVEDSLTGVCYLDDSQIVRQDIEKHYGDRFETHVIVESLEESHAVDSLRNAG